MSGDIRLSQLASEMSLAVSITVGQDFLTLRSRAALVSMARRFCHALETTQPGESEEASKPTPLAPHVGPKIGSIEQEQVF